MKDKLLRANLYLGLAVHGLAWLLFFSGVSFMATWFYIFAWWSFLLILDSLNLRRTGASPLSESGGGFLRSAFVSVFIWLLFELFNLRLQNWSYHSLPESIPLRWLGYSLAFATVVPALRELAHFYGSLLGGKKIALFRFRMTEGLIRLLFGLGLACLVLPLVWPNLFFPLVWLCFVFLLEPWAYIRNRPSLLRDLERGDWTRFWSWLAAGITAGGLWEFWNFWAHSHWEYHLPYLDFGRLFQMPVLGYTGFLPFALEVFALSIFLDAQAERWTGRFLVQAAAVAGLILFYAGAFSLIDRFSLIR